MTKFLTGFKQFQKTYFRDNTELFSKLAVGQAPKTLVIGCCDSRVDPTVITGADPGDMFTIRNVANLVPPYNLNDLNSLHGVSAAIEYAVNFLKVEDIIVLGHVKCGGIAALMGDVAVGEFIMPWMSIAKRARETVVRKFVDCPSDVQHRACERAAILVSLENLCSYPWIRDRLKAKTLTINGWYFDFEAGELYSYSPTSGGFEPMQHEPESATSLSLDRPALSTQKSFTSSGLSCPVKFELDKDNDAAIASADNSNKNPAKNLAV